MPTRRLSPEELLQSLDSRVPESKNEQREQESSSETYTREADESKQKTSAVETFYSLFPSNLESAQFEDNLNNESFTKDVIEQILAEDDSYHRNLLINLIMEKVDELEQIHNLAHPEKTINFKNTKIVQELLHIKKEAKQDFASKYEPQRLILDEEYDQAAKEIYKPILSNMAEQNTDRISNTIETEEHEQKLSEQLSELLKKFGGMEAELTERVTQGQGSAEDKLKLVKSYINLLEKRIIFELADKNDGAITALNIFLRKARELEEHLMTDIRIHSEKNDKSTTVLKKVWKAPVDKATGEL